MLGVCKQTENYFSPPAIMQLPLWSYTLAQQHCLCTHVWVKRSIMCKLERIPFLFNWQHEQSDRLQFFPRANFATYVVRSWRPLLSWSEQHALMNLLLQLNDKQQIFSFWVTCFSQGWLHHLHWFTQRHISKRRSVKDLVYNALNTTATQFYSV